jgi:murein L,D-transpeptidase YafK
LKDTFVSMKQLILSLSIILITFSGFAQYSFVDLQKTNSKVAGVFKVKEDTLQKQFEAAQLQWPPKQLYIRSFKYDSQLEVWVRNNSKEAFKLFKTYKICALSGALGPKRIEGDYQVPEGFYTINLFNPKSTYHLSLGLNYPNASDALLSDSTKPGGDIYIHGNCITVGCIPITDKQIEELYILASYAKNAGQDFIPVHIFPIRFTNPKSVEYYNKVTKDDEAYHHFTSRIKEAFDYFEQYKKLPLISVNKKGEYVIM